VVDSRGAAAAERGGLAAPPRRPGCWHGMWYGAVVDPREQVPPGWSAMRRSWLLVLVVGLGAVALARVRGDDVVRAATGGSDRFRVVSCSEGRSGGKQLAGADVDVPLNAEVRIDFSQGVDWTSLQPPAFQVLSTSSGISPASDLFLDPADPQTLVWRARVTFDALGNPCFALSPGGSYQLLVPGAQVDPLGPYLTSVRGLPVENRLLCTLSATQSVCDWVPGPPVATALVDVAVPSASGATALEPTPAPGAREVALTTTVELRFDDVMYLGTLVVPATGISSSVHVGRAPDPAADPIAGSFSFSIHPTERTTALTFVPERALPAGETILVRLDPSITDLAGNPLRNPGTIAFATVER